MGVHVDPGRRHDRAVGVDFLARRLSDRTAYRDNAAICHADVAAVAFAPGAIEDVPPRMIVSSISLLDRGGLSRPSV